ncbi:MAG: hypothetical protein LBI74_05815 [Synergistaceae bacterium]|jgi:hypothetical protein|nr:hypothetical protein [Synergistaceae bacterium]
MDAGIEHIDAALARSFEGILGMSGEMREKLSEIEECPKPCNDGTVDIHLSSGQVKNFPCPLLAPGCHYGERMEQGLDRHVIGVMSGIGVPLRHLDNFQERQDTEERAEAAKWPVRGFLILTGEAGSGKSFLAAFTLREYLKDQVVNHFDRRSWKSADGAGGCVMWCTATEIADDREIAAQTRRERLVIIDDLGCENDTPVGGAAVRGVLMKRYDMKLPTIITTPLTMLDMDIRYGSRIANRLIEDIGNGGRIVCCRGEFTRTECAFNMLGGR